MWAGPLLDLVSTPCAGAAAEPLAQWLDISVCSIKALDDGAAILWIERAAFKLGSRKRAVDTDPARCEALLR